MTRNKKLVKMMALAVAASTVATSVPAYAAFDATYYAQQNPDVVAAIGTKPADLETHYNVFGKKEGRAGSADEAGSALRQLFDAEYYAKLNPDVAAVYGNDANALFSHFLQFGIKEGRRINPYFDVNAYKKAYPDLVAAFGDDIAAYYNHFANHGIKEHRTLGGFPAEKIVPGGVAVASSGGSSSSSSGGGGGSSKPAPKPADTTPTPTPTPTPDTTPKPTPDDGKQEESLPSEVEVAQAAIENATKKVEAELEKYDSENLPTDAQKAELVKSTKAIVDSSRELKDQTAQAATAAAAELTAAEAKLTSLQAKIAAGAAKTASLTAASNIRGAADAEVAVLNAQYDVEVKQAAYNEAVKERKAAQVAYDSAMDVARDLIKNVFEKDPSTYDSTFLRHDPTPNDQTNDDDDGVADVLEALYKVTNANLGENAPTTLGDKLRKAEIVKADGKFDSAETVANKKKAYVTGKVGLAKEEAVKALIDEYFELAAEAQPTATSTARMSAILKELYGATVIAYNKDGAVVTPGGLVDTEVVNETVAYKWKAGVDANDNGVEADEVLAYITQNSVTGKVSSIDEEKLAADATTEIETMISNYEKCQEADDKLTNPNGDGKTAEDVLLKAVYDEKEAEMNLYNANVVLNGGTKKKIDDSAQTEHVQDVKFVSKDENAEIKGKVELRDEAVKDKDTSIAARDAIYAAEGLDGATRESLGAADAQAEVVAADVIAKGKADIAADKADKANEKAEKNWTEAKALDTQKDENAQP